MRTARTIGASQVSKRRLALVPVEEVADSLYLRNIAVNSIKHGNSSAKADIMNFFRGTANYKSANRNYEACLNMIKRLDENEAFNEYAEPLAVYMASDIVPYIENMREFAFAIERAELKDNLYKILKEAADVNDTCDHIIRNDQNIRKRFNLDRYIKENAFRPVTNIAIDICQMIDTFDTPAGAKFNIALEEISYLYQSNGIEYSKADMVKAVTEYFLHREQNADQRTFDSYKKVLSESSVIEDKDLEGVEYFLKEDFVNTDPVDVVGDEPTSYDLVRLNFDTPVVTLGSKENKVLTLLDAFKASTDKREEVFFSFIDAVLGCDLKDIIDALQPLIVWFSNFALNSLYNVDTLKAAWKKIIAHLIDVNMSIDICNSVNSKIQAEIDRISHILVSFETEGDDDVLSQYFEVLKKISSCLVDYVEMHTDADAVKKDLGIEEKDSVGSYSTKAFTETFLGDIGNFCDRITREFNSNNVYAKSITEKANTLFWSEKDFHDIAQRKASFLDCVTENGVFDHTIAIFDVKSHEDIAAVREDVANFCRSINRYGKTNHAYYDVIDSIIELHVENDAAINLTISEQIERDDCVTEAELTYFGMLESLCETNDTFCDLDEETFMKNFNILEDDMTAEDVCNIIELSSVMGGLISYERINEIADRYHINNPNDFYGNTRIKDAIDSWSLQTADVEIMAEAVNLLNEAMLNEIDFKVKTKAGSDNKESKEEKGDGSESNGVKHKEVGDARKETGKGPERSGSSEVKDKEDEKEKPAKKDKLSFNSLKFAAINLKKKAQRLDTKSKQIANEVDMQANRFMKAVKELYRNDNREAIIRGSIVPSFHKLFERAVVGAVGSGIVAIINPAAAIATAALYVFSLIAISKHNTTKERALLLDEIDIELDIIEKEIHRAEEQNKMKNYRRLVTHKKKLQRERARIKYRMTYKDFVVHDLPDREE